MKNYSKKLLTTFLSSLILCGYSTAALAWEEKITILFTNDTHNHLVPFEDSKTKKIVGGIARRAKIFREMKAKNPRTIILDAGDVFQGTPLYNFFRGKPDIMAMNLAGYDAMAMGNHDLDNGLLNLKTQSQYSHFPILNANIKDKNGHLIFRPFQIFNLNGIKIAVIGLMSQHAWQAVGLQNKKSLTFTPMEDVLKKIIPQLKPKVDLIVLSTHAGLEFDVSLSKKVPGIDVITGGHSHTKLEKARFIKNGTNNGIGGTIVHQAHRWGKYVGKIDLFYDNGQIKRFESGLIEVNDKYNVPDSDPVKKIVAKYQNQIKKEMNVTIGESTQALTLKNKYNGPFPLGNIISDVIRKTQNVDIGIINTGGVRSNLNAGPITVGEIFQILPFDNAIVKFRTSGSEVERIIKTNASRLGKAKNMQFSGLVYSYQNGQVKDIKVGGQPLDTNKTYSMATVDFVFDGGEKLDFKTNASQINRTGIIIRDLMLDFVKKYKIITPPTDTRLIRL